MRIPLIVSHCSLLFLLVTSIALVPVVLLQAQEAEPSVSAPSYDLSWWTVDGGGSTQPATSRSYSLVGTIGQPDAGEMASSQYDLAGGFWAIGRAGGSHDHQIYLPLVVRNTP